MSKFTRRQILDGALALGLVAIASPVFGAGAARAQDAQSVDKAKIAEPGPLGDHVMGDANAPVTVIEYASLTCSHCAHFATTTFPELKKKYIDTGKVRYILREFPLDPVSAAAFMLSRCAPSERYYDVVDLFFEKQNDWAFTNTPLDSLNAMAKQIGFSQQEFEACLTNQSLLDGVNAVKDRGAKDFGVNATPTFFVNGQVVRGALPIAEFDAILEPLLPKE